MSRSVVVGMTIGAGYALLGTVGFISTVSKEFAAEDNGLTLAIFRINPFHSLIHLAIGASLLFAAWVSRSLARTANVLIGCFCLTLALFGTFYIGTPANIIAVSHAGNLLHLLTGICLVTASASPDSCCEPRLKPRLPL